jgi:hypothetical protein
MVINLVRTVTSDEGTFGQLYLDNKVFLNTGEPPWRDNRQSISCIPNGEYECKRVDSPKFGNVYQICNVPNRSHILIHAGNWVGDEEMNLRCDSYGCIVVGMNIGTIHGQKAVLSSRSAIEELNRRLGEESFTIIISETL